MGFNGDVASKRGGDETLLEAHQSRRVSEVRKVPKPKRERLVVRGRGRADGLTAPHNKQQRDNHQGSRRFHCLALVQWRPHSLTSPCSHHQRPALSSSP